MSPVAIESSRIDTMPAWLLFGSTHGERVLCHMTEIGKQNETKK